jgi:hypothetical protein
MFLKNISEWISKLTLKLRKDSQNLIGKSKVEFDSIFTINKMKIRAENFIFITHTYCVLLSKCQKSDFIIKLSKLQIN